MTTGNKKIAFKVEFSRILELLADQIYQSPLALLRENTQNAYDAVLMRQKLGHQFEPLIRVDIQDGWLSVIDNGIGMTAQEIEDNYWYAGRSGKNTEFARAAGVVGTFGIGAMANFGTADELTVESESAISAERTVSSVLKSQLSTHTEGIAIEAIDPIGKPGTTIRAHLDTNTQVSDQTAREYLRKVVRFVPVPILFNGENLSGSNHRDVLPTGNYVWSEQLDEASLAGILDGDVEILGMGTGELRVVVENIASPHWLGKAGGIVLVQNQNVVHTLRSGFGLATVGIQSPYLWGGIVDVPFLNPTAGREALEISSHQWLQSLISSLDDVISRIAAEHDESFVSTGLLQWIVNKNEFELCRNLDVTIQPGNDSLPLQTCIERGITRYYRGNDSLIVQAQSSEEDPLIVLSRRSPRRNCEWGFLRGKGAQEIDTSPRVEIHIQPGQQTFAQSGLAIRLANVLEEDYFVNGDIRFGSITGTLPLLVTERGERPTIVLDPKSNSVEVLLEIYDKDYAAFTPFVKDFARTTVFPKISDLVPSRTRKGADGFLKHLLANREWFEYETEDQADLEGFFKDLGIGRLTASQAARQVAARRRSIIEVSSAGTGQLDLIVNENDTIVAEEDDLERFEAKPGIDRRNQETNALILTGEHSVNGYACFLALSSGVQRESGDFFLRPHSTEVIWGGRKVIFIFQHHSRRFGLYYDILCPRLVGAASAGGPQVTSTINTKGRTFIPIPNDIAGDFLPIADERKRLSVRGDIIHLEDERS